MAQHIGCIKEDEKGILIEDSGLNFAPIIKLLWDLDPNKENYPWLLTVPTYNDATFNELQIPYLIAELQKLQRIVKPEISELVIDFVKFISSTNSPHVYIKFIGD